MRLEQLHIENLRCLRSATVRLGGVTPLIGVNGSGKSTVVRALEFFFGLCDFGPSDLSGGDLERELRVSATFSDLPAHLANSLGAWLSDSGKLTITKVGVAQGDRLAVHFESKRNQVPDFQLVRALATAAEQVAAYKELRKREPFTDLPAVTSGVRVRAAMAAWEREKPEACETADDTSLAVGDGSECDISRWIHLVSIPAVHDAATESEESRSNVFGPLTELLVRSRLDLEDQLQKLQEDAQGRYEEIVSSSGDDVLRQASTNLTKELRRYAPGSTVHLGWDMPPVSISQPRIRAELGEGGFRSAIGNQGHGVQRAYMFALLQALAAARLDEGMTDADDDARDAPEKPLLLLAIEEPELYQHPVRAQLLARVVRQLADGDEPPTQVLYATHSPYFVGLDLIDSVQLLRNSAAQDEAPSTTVTSVDMEAAAVELWAAAGRPGQQFTATSLRSRLAIFTDTRVSEGLFARAVVLVEGQEDVAFLEAAQEQERVDLASAGIAVLPVGGKTCLDRPLVLLRQLGIPTYVLFDGDAGQNKPRPNRLLLALHDESAVDAPSTLISSAYAVFEEDFQRAVESDVGEAAFQAAINRACEQHGFAAGDGGKNGTVLRTAFQILGEAGHRSALLAEVMASIRALV